MALVSTDVTDGPILTLIKKRIRGLRKKLKRIAQLEESVISQGKSAIKNKDQEEFLKSKPAIVAAVDELEKFRCQPNLSATVDEEINLAIQHRQSENNGYKEVDHHSSIIATNKSIDNEQNPKSDSCVVEDLLSLIYLGCMFDVKFQGDFSSIMLTRTRERKYVTDDDAVKLGEKDLNLISMMSSLLISSSRSTNSSVTSSHHNALHRCIQHANLWLAKSEQPIDSNSSDVTYAALRKKLDQIMGSDFLKITPEINIQPTANHVAAEAAYGFQVPEQNYTMSHNLCQDLIFEIFTRLPSTTLIRFRLLSQSLCSCIGSPDFIRMHTSRSPQKIIIHHSPFSTSLPHFYTLHTKDQLPTHRSQYIGMKPIEAPYNVYYRCVGSCNGIICLIDCENGITLWNPSIRRKIILPNCLGKCHTHCAWSRNSCGPHRAWIGCATKKARMGFGFDPITDDYKIVTLPNSGGTGESSYVYTMKTGDWCAITSPTPPFIKVTSCGCFVNGALHWVAQRHLPESNDVISHYILTFDLSTHDFGMITLPKPIWETKVLTIIQSSLAAISSKDGYSRVWVMIEYNNTDSWSVFFEKERNLFEGALNRVLQPTSNSDLLLFNTEERSFRVYDLKTRSRPFLWGLNDYTFMWDIGTYIESLQLLDMGTACQPLIFDGKKVKEEKIGIQEYYWMYTAIINGFIHV